MHFIQIIIQVAFLNMNSQWSTVFSFAFSVAIILFALVFYVAICKVSPKLRKDMAKQYPEYKFA